MHHAESRRRFFGRLLPILGAALALGVVAFYVTRAVHPHTALPHPVPVASSAPPRDAVDPTPSATVAFGPPASARPDPPRLPPTTMLRPPAPKTVERAVVVESVRPPFGVLYAIDGASAGEASSGLRILLDGKAHQLTFTCKQDTCEPFVQAINPGDDGVTIAVDLAVRPATLIVDGDPSARYGVEEYPSIDVRVGIPVKLQVQHAMVVHVIERPSGRKASAMLKPGKEAHAAFSQDEGGQ
jgi:hypothetical protein